MTDHLPISALDALPGKLARPKFAQLLFERGLSYQAAGDILGRSRQWVANVCLPFDDRRRCIPNEDDMRRIVAWTRGELGPADFYPPDLSAAPVAANDEVRP